MFLRGNRRKKNEELYEYWTRVESYRTERGPRQRIVATLGKYSGLDEDQRFGWESVAAVLAIGRFCRKASDLARSEAWYARTALDELLGISTAGCL